MGVGMQRQSNDFIQAGFDPSHIEGVEALPLNN